MYSLLAIITQLLSFLNLIVPMKATRYFHKETLTLDDCFYRIYTDVKVVLIIQYYLN